MNPPKIAVDLILKKLAEDTEKVRIRAQKASEVLLSPLNTDIATTPHDVVYQEDRIKLKHYKPAEVRYSTPLLVVYALINRETMLDLQPERSVVRTFLEHGLEVYMMDWGYPSRKDRYLTIDDHVNGYMDNVVDFIRARHQLPQINLMGICMGGSFSVMYAALHPEKIRNLIATVTPTNFDTDAGLLHVWTRDMDADTLVDSYGNMPGDIMNLGFLLLNPARLMIDKYMGFFENIDSKPFVENFIRMEKWIFDSPAVPGETFRQFIKDCYHQNLLIQSKMELDGKRVDLKNITMPLLNIYAKFDHLVPPRACELLTQKVGSQDVEDVCLETGHIGIYVSSKIQQQFAPKILDWLKARDGSAKTQAAGKKASGRRKSASKAKPAARSGAPATAS
ncbi:MAG: class III poly(R)-hydroxyalkanoic acid synthase subunit PhaC [Desulfobacterales bacterium]|nr:MAG: class III poly(R)-hydroxyalkanoic acid synthase subunit PhaC [Desulfobacterales bacterium]